MAEVRYQKDCKYCGEKESVNVIMKQTKNSRSLKVMKCSKCKRQNGIKESL
jgi:hypothetical protein